MEKPSVGRWSLFPNALAGESTLSQKTLFELQLQWFTVTVSLVAGLYPPQHPLPESSRVPPWRALGLFLSAVRRSDLLPPNYPRKSYSEIPAVNRPKAMRSLL